jgi:hypothetical protein
MMPGCNAAAIPEIVRRYENPESADALPGAISLERHDALHILLGRGIGCQDEGFVVGFTMGAATEIQPRDIDILAQVASNEYPLPFRWANNDVTAFRLAYNHAQRYRKISRDLHNFPFECRWSMPISELRKQLGIDPVKLCATYREEQRTMPASWVSRRLPTFPNELQRSRRSNSLESRLGENV